MKITKILAAVALAVVAITALGACQCHKQSPAPAALGTHK